MNVRPPSPHLIQPVIERPISDSDRDFLRMLKNAGGCMQLVRMHDKKCAEACQKAGYVLIRVDQPCTVVLLTAPGQSYLNKIMGAH